MAKKTLEGNLNKTNKAVPTREHIRKELSKLAKHPDKRGQIKQFLADIECPDKDQDAILDDLVSYPEYYA